MPSGPSAMAGPCGDGSHEVIGGATRGLRKSASHSPYCSSLAGFQSPGLPALPTALECQLTPNRPLSPCRLPGHGQLSSAAPPFPVEALGSAVSLPLSCVGIRGACPLLQPILLFLIFNQGTEKWHHSPHVASRTGLLAPSPARGQCGTQRGCC